MSNAGPLAKTLANVIGGNAFSFDLANVESLMQKQKKIFHTFEVV